MMTGKVRSFRSSPALDAAIDAEVLRRRVTEPRVTASALIFQLLTTALELGERDGPASKPYLRVHTPRPGPSRTSTIGRSEFAGEAFSWRRARSSKVTDA